MIEENCSSSLRAEENPGVDEGSDVWRRTRAPQMWSSRVYVCSLSEIVLHVIFGWYSRVNFFRDTILKKKKMK
ncbi:hypothetical protein CDAR_303661 [Caerostris darwini]|uniref:Uncharacterized protein n=1 Tax=Caerostris darwini TaxID=1538125 RepID=A0AAV4US65_9ARAC|nr:hypothetical protein CDAR_303661 [Caerostris darwini]